MSPDQLGFYTLLKKKVMCFWVRRDVFDGQRTSNPPNAAPWVARPGRCHMDVSGGVR